MFYKKINMKLTFGKLAIGVAVVWLIALVGLYFLLPSWSVRGQFGDTFGAVNALFSGLAFSGLFWSLRVQQEQLELQRAELKLQREELALTRDELAKQATAQADHAETAIRTAKINGLGALFQGYAQFLGQGKGAFVAQGDWYNEVQQVRRELKTLLKQ